MICPRIVKIWIYLNGLQQGPYTIEQLRLLPLTPETPVWYEGLPQWTPAAQAPAIAAWFNGGEVSTETLVEAPALATEGPADAPVEVIPQRPNTYLVFSILLTVLCCSPFAIAAIITGSMCTSRYNQGRYQAARSMSEVTEWLLILAVVFAIIGLPLCLALSLI